MAEIYPLVMVTLNYPSYLPKPTIAFKVPLFFQYGISIYVSQCNNRYTEPTCLNLDNLKQAIPDESERSYLIQMLLALKVIRPVPQDNQLFLLNPPTQLKALKQGFTKKLLCIISPSPVKRPGSFMNLPKTIKCHPKRC
jgi:hypothetical protein